MAIQGFFTGDVKIRDLNGVLKAVDGIVEVATDAGTVTSVGIQVGSTGTDVNVANSPVTTSGNITLNLPTASATNRGLLSSADWAIFDAKQGSITLTTTGNNGSATLTSGTLNIPTYTLAGLGGISLTSLSASSPLAYNNTTGAFSIQVANGSQNGYLSSSDWTTFNSKQSALTFSSPLVNTSGTISIPAATSSVNGYLTSTDWATFNNKQGAITLTTTGSSGAATLIGTTLNIPNYSGALTGYVPYTGATGNVDLGEYGISSGYFQADLTPSGTLQVGRMQWNSTDGTMDLRLMGNNVTLQIGQEQVARVVNGTGVNLLESNYQAVKIIGAQGQRLQVGLARADNDANSKDTLGLVTENINNNQEGFITISGLVNEINTTGSLQGETWADGDTLYLSGTTSGAITNVKPTAPIHTVIVGFVVYAHANHGKIFVKVDNGYELEELHDVAPTPYVNKGVLYRDTATNLWKSATIGTLLGYTPANAATTLTINGTAYDLSANRTWNVGTVTSIGTSGPLTGGTITGSGTIGITQATTSTDGYLSSTDWNTFNNKQAAGSYITALTGEATATGPGSASVTLSTSAVTGKILTGLNLTGGGTIADTDSILQAFGKVQNQISGLAGGVTYQGVWNASTNTPTLTSSVGTKGYYYIVDVAGSTNLNGITDWKIGDWAIFNGSTWDKVDNTDAVSSVNGFTGAVSLTTSNIAEGTNLYYLDSRARLALSFTAGSGAYDNTTGVITIPTNTSQLTNGANFITLSSLSASSPLSYNNVSGAFSIQVANGSQNGYLSSSDWTTFNNKQAALTLTTTGSSGSSTLVGATLNVPTYTLSGLGGVPTSRTLTINGTSYDLSSDRTWSVGTITGTGTSNYLPKWQSSSALGDSLVYDASTAILIGTTTASTAKFMVYSATADNHYQAIGSAPSFRFADTITSPTYTGIIGLATASNHFIVGAAAGDMVLANNTTSSLGNFIFGTGTTERMRITPTGNVSINNTNNTYRFDVNGTVRFTGQLRLESTITNGTHTYTLPSATGTLALTSDIPSGGITGSGTTNYLPKFTGTSSIGDSIITDNGYYAGFNFTGSGSLGGQNFGVDSVGAFQNNLGSYGYRWLINGGGTEIMRLNASGNLSIGNTNDSYKLDVSGASRILASTYTAGAILYLRDAAATGSNTTFGGLFLGSSPGTDFVLGKQSTNAVGSFAIKTGGGTTLFTLADTGAATFSSDVTTNATYNITNGLKLWGNHITTEWYNGLDTIFVNYRGYNSGTTQFRNFAIYNGKNSQIALFEGSTGAATFSSNVRAENSITSAGSMGRFGGWYDGNGYTGAAAEIGVSSGTAYVIGYNRSGSAAIPIVFGNAGNTSSMVGSSLSFTGAATFSSSIHIPSSSSSGQGYYYFDYLSSAAASRTWRLAGDYNAYGDFVLQQSTTQTGSTFSNILRFDPTGAATFSSSVTSQSLFQITPTTTTDNALYRATNAGGTAYIGLDSNSGGLVSQYALNLYHSGAYPIIFSTSGVERMRITSNGGLNVGTTTGNSITKLNVQADATRFIAFEAISAGGNKSVYIRPVDSGIHLISSNYITGSPYLPLALSARENNADLYLSTGGNVGIGTTSPTDKFNVVVGSNGNNTRLDGPTSGLIFQTNATTTDIISYGGTTPAYRTLNFSASASTNMTITTAGNVGIGTTSPSQNLHVASSGVSRILIENTANASTGAGLQMLVTSGGTQVGNGTIRTDNSDNMQFFNLGGERIRITSGGNVGIGTTSPASVGSYKVLDIQGSSGAMLYLSSNGSDGGRVYGNSGGLSYDAFAAGHTWYTPGGERMRITSGGQLLIGTTSSSGVDKVRVNNDGTTSYSTVNITNANSTAIMYVGVGGSSVANSALQNNAYVWNAAASSLVFGTSDSERMRITSSGNIGINTNNPQRQLDVASPSIAYIRTTQGTGSVFNEMYSTSTGGFIGTASSHNLSFQTAGMTRMTLTNGGLLFINTTMQVSTGFVSLVANLGSNIGVAIRSTNSMNSGTFIQFQNNSSMQAGAITHTGVTTVAYGTTSDYRLKQDFQDFNGLDLLGKIKMYNYEWKGDKTRAYGVIAHELQSILKYAVIGVKDGEDMQSVDYSKIVPVNTKAIQELHSLVLEQQAQINELKSQLNK